MANSHPQKERETAIHDMTTKCTVCGLTKDKLNNKGIDWNDHTDEEHNIWSYIHLFYYLEKMERKYRKNLKKNISAIKFEVKHVILISRGAFRDTFSVGDAATPLYY